MPLLSNSIPEGFMPSDFLTKDALPWLAAALVASPVVYYGIMAVYNIFLHPLSKYPGPKSWVATPFHYSLLQLRGLVAYQMPQQMLIGALSHGPGSWDVVTGQELVAGVGRWGRDTSYSFWGPHAACPWPQGPAFF
ncbi:hypothetical protein Micbo1qcDRAFT_225566 [Microdochium bolleyi]|uniref:Uncharacterized protein n=1 Tax=Microdochium bolleyi TaxID=196109 RepID=A0A136IIY3_9PEZI|nr:hypothetical protein Micbo1qcDRAFT_225566 [Microdochium bolleyi]